METDFCHQAGLFVAAPEMGIRDESTTFEQGILHSAEKPP